MSASQFPPLQSKVSTKRCTNCSAKMALYSLPGHYGASVDIDVCMDCNAIWFDQYESTLLSPDGTVALFQLINERGGTSTSAAAKFGEGLRCVTCGEGMKLTHDQVKGTRFSYQACRKGHGRLTTFHNFLAEKQFVRELTKAERAKLSATVGQIRCSGCGAAVNIGKVDACEYCRAPVSVFDREAAKKAIDDYLQERQKQPAPVSGNRREAPRSEERWSTYDRVDLGSDILYALGRLAARGLGGAFQRRMQGGHIGDGGVGGFLHALFDDLGVDRLFLQPVVDRQVEVEHVDQTRLHALDIPLFGIAVGRARTADDHVDRLGTHIGDDVAHRIGIHDVGALFVDDLALGRGAQSAVGEALGQDFRGSG